MSELERARVSQQARRLSRDLPSVRRTDPDTSKAAAVLGPHRIRQRAEILAYIRSRSGWTSHELQEATGIRLNSLTRRITDLKELDLVYDTGDRRMSPETNRPLIVWAAL